MIIDQSLNDNTMTRIHQIDDGRPVSIKKDRNTEFNVKFCISVFLLHAGRPTSISLMFNFRQQNRSIHVHGL